MRYGSPALFLSFFLLTVGWAEQRPASPEGPRSEAEAKKSASPADTTRSNADETNQRSKLGIGFLVAPPTEGLVSKLTSEKDFVDLMVGPGKIPVIQRLLTPASPMTARRPTGAGIFPENDGTSRALSTQPTIKSGIRVGCISRSLSGIEETISLLKRSNIQPQRIYVAYNPEQSPGTPREELEDFLGSLRRGQIIVEQYRARFLVGPGLRYMEEHEDLYPEAAKLCDAWLIQSQRLQMDAQTRQAASPKEYRDRVKRIVDLLRRGNPKIEIFVQVLAGRTKGETLFTPQQLVAYALAVEDLVDAVRIYGGQPELISEVIRRLRPTGP